MSFGHLMAGASPSAWIASVSASELMNE